ncbi:MAG: WSD1 family O-acyltransferase, partial [Haliea sp.]|nr:WSD1 family O-acyltransferase [Haliea sp.]
GVYPASIVFDGFAMNITLVSYRQQLDFGIVACRRSMPQVQRIIDYLEEALVELEELAGSASVQKPAVKRAVKSTVTPKKASAKKTTAARKPRRASQPKLAKTRKTPG